MGPGSGRPAPPPRATGLETRRRGSEIDEENHSGMISTFDSESGRRHRRRRPAAAVPRCLHMLSSTARRGPGRHSSGTAGTGGPVSEPPVQPQRGSRRRVAEEGHGGGSRRRVTAGGHGGGHGGDHRRGSRCGAMSRRGVTAGGHGGGS